MWQIFVHSALSPPSTAFFSAVRNIHSSQLQMLEIKRMSPFGLFQVLHSQNPAISEKWVWLCNGISLSSCSWIWAGWHCGEYLLWHSEMRERCLCRGMANRKLVYLCCCEFPRADQSICLVLSCLFLWILVQMHNFTCPKGKNHPFLTSELSGAVCVVSVSDKKQSSMSKGHLNIMRSSRSAAIYMKCYICSSTSPLPPSPSHFFLSLTRSASPLPHYFVSLFCRPSLFIPAVAKAMVFCAGSWLGLICQSADLPSLLFCLSLSLPLSFWFSVE